MTLVHPGARLRDAASGELLEGDGLAARVAEVAASHAALPPGVLFLRVGLDVPSVLAYLGALEARRAVALLDPGQDRAVLDDLVARFRPAAVIGAAGEAAPGYGADWVREDAEGVAPHPDLAVLLPTSGSTGNPKFVRLSRAALLANAEAIAEVLAIGPDEVAPTTLPLHYSYGMSVLNSHLLRGATVLLEGSGVVARPFWDAVAEHGATSLAGVPYHYEMLRRLKFDPAKYPTLRTLTQAGGRLRTELVTEFNDRMIAVGGRMFVMYGQTEAAPRMATVPAERLADKLGSAGRALPGGSFAVRLADGSEVVTPDVVGEIVYRGPNVMMGYAEAEAELALPDQVGGVLATGDLGYLDAEGYLYVTGRSKRIGKVFGNRVNLDDLERLVKQFGVAAAVPAGDKVVVWLDGATKDGCKAAAKALAEALHLHVTGFDVRPVDGFPLLASGKVDYRSLEAQV
ncbi:AMP-binding protein [Actinosynnema sp. NPDC047251]|uniref:AMP-dependent acyl-CoA synthetase/AMP-acid ligases II n=1 Tax=Saccharothrix espanaensis (strain ATCC 51144 / DSM 44229 / JCM 9112 / NBRC 15066 / NRRL 15764) TaxID=1179773 RepID=K0JNN2_SACES|nr:AMP-binding protein [Saccharothrix espanaensis]CCH27480.1 AMP-dependent acyl-CoA synthetase/AMP-acid ligases II [Saccharothrix espanaensis DSM 44229]